MIIGLTGGIGSGKTTVLQLFKDRGFAVFIADEIAKEITNSNVEVIKVITHLFGEKAYLNGKLNNNYIAEIVFNNNTKLKQLNAIVHPKVKEAFLEFCTNSKSNFIIYEAAILFESGSFKFCDYIITVTADLDVRINRILKRDKITKEAIMARIKSQIDDDFKIKQSNFVILNNGSIEQLKLQVQTIANTFQALLTNSKSS